MPNSQPASPPPAPRGVSVRAIAIGLVLVVAVCFIVSFAELVITSIQIGFLQMPPVAIGLFFFLALANQQARRLSAKLGLSAGELLTIYTMMLVAAMVASRGVVEKIIPLLVSAGYFANESNRWQELFFPHIRRWMVAFDPEGGPNQPVAKRFFEGLPDGDTIPWDQWIVPLIAWGILVGLVVFAFLCLASIMRRQWVDNEKLTFPLVQLPLEMATEQKQSILRNRTMWAGFAVPAAVFTINGMHNWFPSVPEITLQLYVNSLLVNPPWNQMYWTTLFLSFAAVGFFFLLPSELVFSVWFFAVFARLQGVAAASLGFDLRRMPVYGTHLFVAYQTAGAYMVLAAYLIYVAVPHLRRVFREGSAADERQELMGYRTALWGLMTSLALILVWVCMAGMSVWVAMLQFGVFLFVIALVMARSTAEAGMLMTETSFRPVDLYAMFAPAVTLGPANLTMLAFTDSAFLRDQRGLLLTGILDGLKLSDGARIRRRSFLPVFVIGILSAMLVAGAIHVWLPYTRGGINLYSYVYYGNNYWPMVYYQSQMTSPPSVDPAALPAFAAGMVVTVFLIYMRSMFLWWPLHPLGYALSVSWTVSVFWFSALIAWILKSAILRYGGMRLFVRARPFFLGMVLGEFVMAVVWALIGWATNGPTPLFPWP